MGVIYKLREDVVSFIIARKKDIPTISVRQLATLTSQQFQIKVSKSSVSGILKKTLLSSSVGRRAGSAVRAEKFSIPATKKQEISKNIRKAGFIQDHTPLIKETIDVRPVKEKKAIIPNKAAEKTEKTVFKDRLEESQINVKKGAGEPAVPEVSREEKPLQKDLYPRQRKKDQGIPISGGMGFVFLKAAQWEISNHSIMGALFKKYIQLPASKHFDAVSDMFLFFKFLGAEAFDHISAYRGHGLWVLNNFCNLPTNESKDLLELQELFQRSKAMTDSPSLPGLIMEYKRAKEQAFLEVKGFQLSLEDGSDLTMDASMSSFERGGAIPSAIQSSLPIDKAMTKLSNCLVSNIQSAVFRAIPGEMKFDRVFYDLVKIFENIPGKRILKVFVLDANEQKIAEFSTVPFQKRKFIVGIRPQMREFEELTKVAKWAGKKSFYHHGTGKTIHFSETKTDFIASQIQEGVEDFRIITIWTDNEKEPSWAILTNQRQDNSEKILKTYMSYWPYLGEWVQEKAALTLPIKEEEKEGVEILNGISDICADFIGALHAYCQKYFFPPTYSKIGINDLITVIYGIPGVYYGSEDEISVFLNMDIDSVYRKDLEYAVKMVNRKHILDYLGRRVWIEA